VICITGSHDLEKDGPQASDAGAGGHLPGASTVGNEILAVVNQFRLAAN
jgi:hypothetical protein